MIIKDERIGNQRLILGDCQEIMPLLGKFDAVVTDPPYSDRCHRGHNSGAASQRDGSERKELGYESLSLDKVSVLSRLFADVSDGWIVWMTDSDLALAVRTALEQCGRYAFAPLPFYQAGRSVRLTGDGPSSWTDWIVVARTKAQIKWGTLPGGYIAGEGWSDKVHMGGKPTRLMKALVRDYSREKQTILDPFMGSGTTLVACQQMGRHGTGIEVDEDYFKIACERVHNAYMQPDLFIGG